MKTKRKINMKDVTVIIPVHEYTEEIKGLVDRAIESTKKASEDSPIIVVGPKTVLKSLKLGKTVKLVENEVSDLPHQINCAVDVVKTNYFSYLELDDVFAEKWFDNVEKYMVDYPSNAVYLPIAEVVNDEEKSVVGFMNEITWASSFSQDMGYFDTEALLNFSNVCTSGGIYDKEMFIELGSLKASMRLFYWYEFLLRASNKSKKIFTIPKIGCVHTINRKGSMSDVEYRTISKEEFDWWFNLAQQEYQFKNDKNKKYEE